eukprot:gene317-947_t
MSWFKDRKEPGFFNSLLFRILKCGHVPQHVAFIMDGNRRYADKIKAQRQIGHSKGFEKLAEVLYWCFQLGIPEVTVYAFSTENFKRSKEEVDGLMNLAEEKFKKLMEEKEAIMKYGISLRVIGDVSLIPDHVKQAIATAVEFSKDNTRSILNVAMAYASRHEITEAIKEITHGIEEGILYESDVNESLVEKTLYTNKCRDIDLLIRTSGEVRLSDFLMWQSSSSMLSFIAELWPEFSIWEFFKCILNYQLKCNTLKEKRNTDKSKQEIWQMEKDVKSIQEQLQNRIENHHPSELKVSEQFLDEESSRYTTEQNSRVRKFLDNLDMKRYGILTNKI